MFTLEERGQNRTQVSDIDWIDEPIERMPPTLFGDTTQHTCTLHVLSVHAPPFAHTEQE